MTDKDDPRDDVIAPIQPTGSGVVDLEIAREQDALADAGEAPRPANDAADLAESEGHPS